MKSKYSYGVIEKAVNMNFKIIDGIFYTEPTTDKDVYKHKITIDKNNKISCGCKWSQINLKKVNKVLCSHALGVLYVVSKSDFWKEVSK